ncbi:hypothetical protein CBR67_03955 [Bordetella hinzii]|uniref:hypothetical protein n=1 Tax=Bordetella hinzii TaxID=103855 RepID=UPI001154A388|nr:hypothetical protein [Bordetella hinzii]QDJ35871.1 hypothetical protein CBR67_03955 [Bordetella hinzii]
MTQQDDITQRVLTDEECISILKFGSSSIAMARAVESAVLSKLRAPVADETQAPHDHDLWFQEYGQTLGAFYNNLTIHTRAAWVAASRQYAALASAPVAGEALDTLTIILEWDDGKSDEIEVHGTEKMLRRLQVWLDRKRGLFHEAAPQASAEPVSDAGTAASDDVVLPPLPFPAPRHIRAAQMKEYARAAVLADRQQRAGDVGEHGAFWWRKGLRATLAPQPAAPHSDLERARQGLPPYNPSMPTEQDWQRITENGRKAWGGAQPAASAEPSDEEIDAIAASMPDGAGGMLKQWGYRQFARALLSRYGRHAGDAEYPLAAKVCAELYQVIGSLASDLGVFDHPKVVKALDNAADHALVHDDVLPFPSFEHKTAGEAQPVAWVAADTIHSPHPTCISSLAYMSQIDQNRGREYVPLYAAPQASPVAGEAVHGQRGWDVIDDMRAAVRFAPSSAYWSERLREFFGPDAREGIDALEKQLREARAALAAQADTDKKEM